MRSTRFGATDLQAVPRAVDGRKASGEDEADKAPFVLGVSADALAGEILGDSQ